MIPNFRIIARRKSQNSLIFKDAEDLFELGNGLADKLSNLRRFLFGIFSTKALAGTANGKTLVVKQRANLADQQYILALIVPSVAPAFNRAERGKLLLPIAQYVGFDVAEVAYFTYGEIAFTRDWG